MSNVRFHLAFVPVLALCLAAGALLGLDQNVRPTHRFAFTSGGGLCGDQGSRYECTEFNVMDADNVDGARDSRDASAFPPGHRVLFSRPERIRAIAWSPDSLQMAFLVVLTSGVAPNYYEPVGSELWTARIDGSHARRLQTDIVPVEFLHALTEVAIVWPRDGAIEVTHRPVGVLSVGIVPTSASPDGAFIAYHDYGYDSGSICVRPASDTLGNDSELGCFGDGFYGKVEWAPF